MLTQREGEERSDPEELLRTAQQEENARGKLTVFLGATAGVGKTFAMLKTAHEKKAAGLDVVIGWVETHGRADTQRAAEGLERVVPASVVYRGKAFTELDVEAVLRRSPQIVVVDELAHTNVKGTRHRRRYQDIEELLDAGINVYTAVNIQHIESLNDIVAKITGVVVHETVPDAFVEDADVVQLVDIAPEALLQRLCEGKIYLPEAAQQALKKFFRLGNISALRELALRFTAQRVDSEMESYMRAHQIEGPWPAGSRVMVGVSGSPFSARLIRAAARLAQGLRSELLAVHVEAAKSDFPIGDAERDRIASNLRLAEALGARTLVVVGERFVEEFLSLARKKNVSAIVIGKTKHRKLRNFFRGSAVDEIVRRSGSVHVYLIQGDEDASTLRPKGGEQADASRARDVWPFALSTTFVALTTAAIYLFRSSLDSRDIALLYTLPVFSSAFFGGRWPSYLSAVLSILAFNYFFVDPVFTFNVADIRNVWSFGIFLVLSFFIGKRTEALREETKRAWRQEKSTRAVYEFSRDIAAVTDLRSIAASLARHAGGTIGRSVVVVLPGESGATEQTLQFDPAAGPSARLVETPLAAAERAAFDWVLRRGQPAGCSTDTLPNAPYFFVPIGAQGKVFAVFGVLLGKTHLTASQRRLIDAWARLAGVAMEKVHLSAQARQAKLLLEADKLRTALFNSVSHELRTPLSAIVGSVSTLLDAEALYSSEDRRELLHNIQESSRRMERLIGNLLDTARLESGMMRIKSDWCDVEDVIGIALRRMEDLGERMRLQVEITTDLPFIKADSGLLEQVLVNLLDNAAKYSPGKADVTISADRVEGGVEIAVADRGEGIAEEEREKIFDKFFRSARTCKVGGTGLGLAICKGIVEAHGGTISANRREGGGTVMRLRLPG